MTPDAANKRIYLDYYKTPWGMGLVAACNGCIIRVYLPQDDEKLMLEEALVDIRAEAVEYGYAITSRCVQQLEQYFEGELRVFDIPLEMCNLTPFQQRVMKAAENIPFGEVRSYAWLGQEAGSPLSARACGQVMAKNRYPVIIPCHRVLSSDGSLGGYSGGLHWKKRLLGLEGYKLKK